MENYFVCSIGGDTYALPLGIVREVREPSRPTRVPGVPDFVIGVTNLRGTIVCVIDLPAAFGVGGESGDPADAREVVLEHRGIRVAVVADAVVGVARPGDLEPTLDGLPADLHRWCKGTLRSEYGLALALDPEFVPMLHERLETAA